MKKTIKTLLTLLTLAIMSFGLVGCAGSKGGNEANADSKTDVSKFPEKPVTIVVPWGSGGNADVFARKVASLASDYIGQEVVVENRTGAGGEIALTEFAQKKPDAHTVLVTSSANFTITPKVKEVQYSYDDFQPLIGDFLVEFILMSNPSKTGIESMEDLKEYAKGKTIKFGTTGSVGNDTHLIQSGLFEKYGIKAEPVVFEGGMDLVNNLLGGHIDVTVGVAPIMDDYLKTGELKGLGTFAPFPYEVEGIDPITPLAEQGYEVSFAGFNYFNVSKGTPQEIVDKLNKAFNEVYEDPEFKKFLEGASYKMNPLGPKEIDEYVMNQSKEVDELLKTIKK